MIGLMSSPSAAFFHPFVFSSLAHFLIGLFIFLELSCMSSLYIFEISCLSVASFAIIFSHSEGFFFLKQHSGRPQDQRKVCRNHLIGTEMGSHCQQMPISLELALSSASVIRPNFFFLEEQ